MSKFKEKNIMKNQYDEILLQKDINNCSYINKLDLISSKNLFTASKPIKHIFLNDLWNETFLDQISQEITNFNDWEGEKNTMVVNLKDINLNGINFHPKQIKF